MMLLVGMLMFMEEQYDLLCDGSDGVLGGHWGRVHDVIVILLLFKYIFSVDGSF